MEHTPGSRFMLSPPKTLQPNWEGTVGVASTEPDACVALFYENTAAGAYVAVRARAPQLRVVLIPTEGLMICPSLDLAATSAAYSST